MTIATVTQRLKAIRRTKLYDLFAAAPLIAWYLFCAAQTAAIVAQQIALIKLFVQTDPSVLPASLVLSTVAHVATLGFLRGLGCDVCGASRSAANRTRVLSTLCRCRRHLSRCRLRAAAAARAFVCALPSLASLDYQRHCFRNLCGAGTRALDQHPAGGSATCDLGALSPSSAIHFILARSLPWLELRCSTCRHGRCCCWDCNLQSNFSA